MPRNNWKKSMDNVLVNNQEFKVIKSRSPKLGTRIYASKDGKRFASVPARRSNKDSMKAITQRIQENIVKKQLEEPKETKEKKVKEPVKKKEKVFRSSYVVGYKPKMKGSQEIEFRIWIHTKKPIITEGNLIEWKNKLFETITIEEDARSYIDQFLSKEINKEIDEDEMVPDKDTNKYYGYAKFSGLRTGGNAEYYAVQSGFGFQRTLPFRVN